MLSMTYQNCSLMCHPHTLLYQVGQPPHYHVRILIIYMLHFFTAIQIVQVAWLMAFK